MNFLGFGQSAEIDIIFDGIDSRKLAEVKTEDGKKEKYLLYYDGETVSGRVNVTLKKPGSKLEHHGIKIELIGQIELYYDRGNHHEFTALVRELARPGDLLQNTSYPFEFANVEKPYEVYVGSNVRLRYFLRVTIVRRLSDIVKEIDIAVHTLCSYPEANNPIKMEVGIEDCLHIEFEYNKSKYHLKDVIVGKIYFLLVRIKIKHMEIAIIKRETTGSGSNTYTENETIAKYEIMDGAPVKGESIPIRVFLAGYDLQPTMRDINKKFSVRYFLNLVLMDTEDRRYFKQQEITLWRKADKGRKSTTGSSSSTNPHMPSHLVGSDGEIMSKPSTQQHQSYPKQYHRSNDNDEEDDDENDDEDDNDNNDDEPKRLTSGNGSDTKVGGGGGKPGNEPMGLFQQDSPQQESKLLPTDVTSNSHSYPDGSGSGDGSGDGRGNGGGSGGVGNSDGITNEQSNQMNPMTPMSQMNVERGAGDGASYQNDENETVDIRGNNETVNPSTSITSGNDDDGIIDDIAIETVVTTGTNSINTTNTTITTTITTTSNTTATTIDINPMNPTGNIELDKTSNITEMETETELDLSLSSNKSNKTETTTTVTVPISSSSFPLMTSASTASNSD